MRTQLHKTPQLVVKMTTVSNVLVLQIASPVTLGVSAQKIALTSNHLLLLAPKLGEILLIELQ